MRVMFMGTPEIAALCFEALAARRDVVCAVTRTDKPKGRGGAVAISPVKEMALQRGIDVVQPKTLRDGAFAAELDKYAPDVIAVVAYGLILPKYVLDYPKYGCVNLHASLLPMYRGAAPIQWCVANGETTGGVTTMLMDEGVDTGDILLRAEVEITPDMTGGQLHGIYCEAGARLLRETLDAAEGGALTPRKQEGASCYAPMLTEDNTRVDWTRPAVEIVNLARAMDPYPAAHTRLDGKKLKIFKCTAAGGRGAPGTIIPDKNRLIVACGDGAVEVGELQLEGKKRMPADAFLRGRPVAEGSALGGTPC